MTSQPDLFAPAERAAPDPNEVRWLIECLRGQDWLRAEEILAHSGLPVSETHKRRIRRLANASGGRVGSGQRGYKLVAEMTAEEFGHFDRWMAHQEAEMQRRRMDASRVFHTQTNPHRVPVLTP